MLPPAVSRHSSPVPTASHMPVCQSCGVRGFGLPMTATEPRGCQVERHAESGQPEVDEAPWVRHARKHTMHEHLIVHEEEHRVEGERGRESNDPTRLTQLIEKRREAEYEDREA